MKEKHIDYGSVSAVLLTSDNNIYTGICINTACSIGMCAERNAISSMINNGELIIKKLVCVGKKGNFMHPCGTCCEFMSQMSNENRNLEILVDKNKTISLKEMLPNWWGDFR